MKEVLDWPEVAIVAEVNDVMPRPADSADLVVLLEKHFYPLFFERWIGRFGSELVVTAARGSGV